MVYNIKAKIYKIGEVQTIPSQQGGDPFRKRSIVLDASRFDPYTGEKSGDNYVVVEFSGKRVEELDKYAVGDLANVSFVLQGRKYNDKATQEERYFTSIVGIGIEMAQMNKRQQEPAATPAPAPINNDNMPF